MNSTALLAIGLDPSFVDFSAMPHLTPERVHGYILAEIARVRELGFDVAVLLIAPDEKAGVDAGLREPPEPLVLFEKILNLVHRLAPQANIAFNNTPADTAEAVLRWMNPRQEGLSR